MDIPKDIEEIINNYKYQLEHLEKYQNCLKSIKNINYRINPDQNGYNILSHSSTRDGVFYVTILTDISETFMAENINTVISILIYNNKQKIYVTHQEEDEN